MTPIPAGDLKTLHEILRGCMDGVNVYWTIYSTVAFALLGYVFAAKQPMQFRPVRWVLAFAFAVFAFCNWHALSKQQSKYFAVSQYVVSKLYSHSDTGALADAYKASQPSKDINLLHVLLDLGVVTLILAAPAIKGAKADDGNG